MTAPTSLADRVWLDTSQAAEYVGRSTVTIRRHAAAGTLRSTSGGRGRHRRYRKEWLDEWAEKAPRLPVRAAS
jgi:excisionase family DNA binding protein